MMLFLVANLLLIHVFFLSYAAYLFINLSYARKENKKIWIFYKYHKLSIVFTVIVLLLLSSIGLGFLMDYCMTKIFIAEPDFLPAKNALYGFFAGCDLVSVLYSLSCKVKMKANDKENIKK